MTLSLTLLNRRRADNAVLSPSSEGGCKAGKLNFRLPFIGLLSFNDILRSKGRVPDIVYLLTFDKNTAILAANGQQMATCIAIRLAVSQFAN